jgi:hypothetical protein
MPAQQSSLALHDSPAFRQTQAPLLHTPPQQSLVVWQEPAPAAQAHTPALQVPRQQSDATLQVNFGPAHVRHTPPTQLLPAQHRRSLLQI